MRLRLAGGSILNLVATAQGRTCDGSTDGHSWWIGIIKRPSLR